LTFFMVAIQLLRFSSCGGLAPPPAAWPPGGGPQPAGLGTTARRSTVLCSVRPGNSAGPWGRCRSTAFSQGQDAGQIYSIRVSCDLPFATYSFDSAPRWR